MFRLTSHLVSSRLGQSVASLAMFFALSHAGPFSVAQAQRVLTVIAADTGLATVPTVPAGLTTVRLVLKGSTRRELVVRRVPAGTMPGQLVRGAAGRPERWFQQLTFGGPAVPRDSAIEASVTVELRPGRYVLVAYEVDEVGRARGHHYVWRDITAIATSVLIPGRFAVPDARIRIKDGSIEVLGALRPGQRMLQVENVGGRPHELIVGRLKQGRTIADVQRWSRDRADAAPFVYVGGITPMSPGVTAQTRLVLQSGVHVVLCPMRGERDRAQDHERGVIASFKVS